MADKDTISWDFIVEDKNNMESIRLGFKNNSETITDVTIMPQSDLDTIHETVNEANNTAIAANTTAETASNTVTNIQAELEEEIVTLEKTIQTQQTTIDNLNSTIDTLNKTIFLDLRSNALYHNGGFGVFAYNLKGEPVTDATTATLKVVYNSGKSTSTVTLRNKGNGVYQKDNFLDGVKDTIVHCYVTFVKGDITVERYWDVYLY